MAPNKSLMSVADALARVLEGAAPLPPESATLNDAHGRVLATDVVALRTQPPADLSAMDGYAVRTADVTSVPATLEIVGEVAAGHPFAGNVNKGQAARIFTGGVVPPGADTIVIQENTKREGTSVIVSSPASSGKHIRRAGLDFAHGQALLPRGRRLTERDLMLAAAMSHPTVAVHRRPRVAVLAPAMSSNHRRNNRTRRTLSNGFALLVMARAEGAEVIDLGVGPIDLKTRSPPSARARRAPISC
jgi:molybdopterin molybdotransferase